jgi:hypothetical protein
VQGQLQGFACCLVVDEVLLGVADLQLIVVVEVAQYTPADLDF